MAAAYIMSKIHLKLQVQNNDLFFNYKHNVKFVIADAVTDLCSVITDSIADQTRISINNPIFQNINSILQIMPTKNSFEHDQYFKSQYNFFISHMLYLICHACPYVLFDDAYQDLDGIDVLIEMYEMGHVHKINDADNKENKELNIFEFLQFQIYEWTDNVNYENTSKILFLYKNDNSSATFNNKRLQSIILKHVTDCSRIELYDSKFNDFKFLFTTLCEKQSSHI